MAPISYQHEVHVMKPVMRVGIQRKGQDNKAFCLCSPALPLGVYSSYQRYGDYQGDISIGQLGCHFHWTITMAARNGLEVVLTAVKFAGE